MSGESLWYDELFTVWVAQRPWSDVAAQAHADGFTPPLFYFLVKGAAACGLEREALRAVPALYGALAVFLGVRASVFLFGGPAALPSALILASSAFLRFFAGELRPYSALVACAFAVVAESYAARQATERTTALGHLRLAALVATLAVAFSYAGIALILIVLWVAISSRAWGTASATTVAAGLLCAPGFEKAAKIALQRNSPFEGFAVPSDTYGILLGPGAAFTGDIARLALLAGLTAVIAGAIALRRSPSFRFLSLCAAVSIATWATTEAAVRTGGAPRYLAVVAALALLASVGGIHALFSWSPTAAWCAAGLIAGSQLVSSFDARGKIREPWREVMTSLSGRSVEKGGRLIVLGFPFHHVAVAAAAYAPSLPIGGGFTTPDGSVLWYDAPREFRGYSFEGLGRIHDPGDRIGSLFSAFEEVCLVTDDARPERLRALTAPLSKHASIVFQRTDQPFVQVACFRQ